MMCCISVSFFVLEKCCFEKLDVANLYIDHK